VSTEQPSKVDAYLDVIEKHVIVPIRSTNLSESCIATLLLVFASIDGLGRLTHPKIRAKVEERFELFLITYFGGLYAKHAKQIYDLRCELVHNALNVSSFMSKTWMGEIHHLTRTSPQGYLFVSSSTLFADFCTAIEMLKGKMLTDAALRAQAEQRLKWVVDDPSSYWRPFSTPPGPVEFVST
jgi:hypothetical protein